MVNAVDFSRTESMGPTVVNPSQDISGGGQSVVYNNGPEVATVWMVGALAVLGVLAVVYLIDRGGG